MKRKYLPTPRTVTKQPPALDGLILFHLCLNNLSTKVWFGKELSLAVDILLGTFFIDRFKRSIFLPNRKSYHDTLNQLLYFAGS